MSDADEHEMRHDRITVVIDGEEIDVFNWVTIERAHRIRPVSHESFEPRIYAGDDLGGTHPDAITKWLANELRHEHLINVETLWPHIDVIDIESDEVTVI